MSYQFYRWFPGDYMMDTMHLSVTQDCMYRRLIDLYNITGKPIRNDRDYILRAVRATEIEHQAATDTVLAEFFVLRIDGWHQRRCDAEVRYRKALSAIGQHGNDVRWKKLRDAKKLHPPGVREESEPEPEPEPEVPLGGLDLGSGKTFGSDKSIARKRAFSVAPFKLPDWIPAEPWEAWVEMRKMKKTPTPDRAKALAVMKLTNLRERGEEAAQVLMQSAFKGWPDLYPVNLGGAR